MRQKITQEVNQKVKITFFDFNQSLVNTSDNEEIHIADYDIIQMITESIGKGVYRSIKDILIYMIPAWLQKEVLNFETPIIHLCISGDGRNVGRKVKHVMFTFAILNDLVNIYKPDNHYTVILYLGT